MYANFENFHTLAFIFWLINFPPLVIIMKLLPNHLVHARLGVNLKRCNNLGDEQKPMNQEDQHTPSIKGNT